MSVAGGSGSDRKELDGAETKKERSRRAQGASPGVRVIRERVRARVDTQCLA